MKRVKFLLDTHCWLWLQTERNRFGADLLEALAAPSSRRYLSAASAWEIAIKYAIGKLPLPASPAIYVPERMRRVLVAQAQMEGLTLVTADSALERYDVPMIRVQRTN